MKVWRGDLGLEQLRVEIFQVIPGVPGMLVAFHSCVGDARPLATLLLFPLVSVSDCSSDSWVIHFGEGRKRGREACACITLRVHPV